MGAAASCGANTARATPPPPTDAPLLQRSVLAKSDSGPTSSSNVLKGPEADDKVSELPTRPRRSRRASSFTEWALGASWSRSGGDRDSSFKKKRKDSAAGYSVMSEQNASALSIMAAADEAAASAAEPRPPVSVFGLATVADEGGSATENLDQSAILRFDAPTAAPAPT